ncbi:glycoside hydrolase family 2 TIM barrel-domain containing protein [Coraliomargarita algicola]|uniref:Glycoside hydrolase family 2 TIM barrel-domain containing protein n=1 Tax=Coraliomargarita algicola TaxID=3092156 RepID=A0ABZ0RHI7_9BACT|nr:glycoside hydrolase family 2 TIM barrel-domain containing protein [Coraliomargarita sp. J2-16]WPJ95621.1 glycoside hydrolase family 2 TIM barrel-domain containing protein [Coraliomargarita sp. J2-16]
MATRFGFREFEIRGRDFYLNGTRTVLLRNSHLTSLTTSREHIFSEVRSSAGNPYNCIRMHLGFNSEALLDLCDELGVLAIPESAWHNSLDSKTPLAERALWLPNVVEYTRGMIQLHRNRPSVILWNLTNESIWGKTSPDYMEVADALVAVAKEMDPTRPFAGDGEVDWGGRLPVTTIHYPESTIKNSLREAYPSSGSVLPNDAHWLRVGEKNESWRAEFIWDKPLVIGEYWYPSGNADPYSAFMGESVYDWQKWRRQRMDGRDLGPAEANEFVKSQQILTDAYRMDGVAGVNPWASDGNRAMPRLAVRPVDFFPNLQSGAVNVRKFVVFNDSGRSYGRMNLQCQLQVEGDTVWETVISAPVGAGEMREFEVPIDSPVVTQQAEAELMIRLRWERAGGWHQLDRYNETVFVMPSEDLSDLAAAQILLFDPSGKTADSLQALGLNVAPTASLTAGDLQGKQVLLVGEDTDATEFKDVIVDFVHSGGRAIVLRQDRWVPMSGQLPDYEKTHLSTRAWRRSFDHPIIQGMDDAQFSYWRPNHLVSIKTFRKPATGRYAAILDSGGLYGLNWSPLVEVPMERGLFLLSSLDLVNRSDVEPAAAHLLGNMLRYAMDWQPVLSQPLRLLDDNHTALRAALDAAGVVYQEGLDAEGPILLDASYTVEAEELSEIRARLEAGAHVWLHGFTEVTIGSVAQLFPFEPKLQAYDPTVQSAVRRSEDPLMNNLSSFDFFWTQVDLEARSDYFGEGYPTAQLGGPELQLPYLEAGERLVHPGLLVKIPVGAGTLLFDNVLWPEALGAETDKVTRIVSALAANQGAEVKTNSDETLYEYSPIDLSQHANMGYYDRVADDGVGGWTDQGDNDMRFFLINHVGKRGGLESGMEIEAQNFPAEVNLAGRKFWLLDPRETLDHAVISLRGGEHGHQLPEKCEGIVVGKKADTLWFLQAAGWTPEEPRAEVARYIIHYSDGTQVVFPIRYGLEISEWWKPQPLSQAKVAWSGRNLGQSPIGIYSTPWSNPHPEKEIATIDMIGNLSPTQVVLLAITAGVNLDLQQAGEVLAEWQLGDFDGEYVPSRVDHAGRLTARTPAPTRVEQDGKSMLHFQDEQSLSGRIADLPQQGGLGSGQPFAVKVVFTPEAKPTGYFAGIFQAAQYGQRGFRMLLDQRMKLVLEIFSDSEEAKRWGITSSVPLELGRSYTAEVRFDGSYVSLLIDGRVDSMVQAGLPTPFNGDFLVGDASGADYYFTGFIESLWIRSLAKSD